MADQDDRPLLHRSGVSSPWGKCDDNLNLPMPGTFTADMHMIARLNGKGSRAEWARDVLCKAVVAELAYMGLKLPVESPEGDDRKGTST